MTEVKRVFVQISPEQVFQGFYTCDSATVTMVYANGEPVLLDEEPVTADAAPDMAASVARALTKKIRRAFLGASVEGFQKGAAIGGGADPLYYPTGSIV